MEPIAALLLAALFYAMRVTKGKRRMCDWREAAHAADLTMVRERRRLGIPLSLTGRAGALHAQLKKYTRGDGETGTRVTISGLAPPLKFSLRKGGLQTALTNVVGRQETELGDKTFDDELYVEGPASLARALLDAETRRLVLTLFHGRVPRLGSWHGARLATPPAEMKLPEWPESVPVRAQVADGVLQADINDSGGRLSTNLADVVPRLVVLAQRLVAPEEIPERISENLRAEPHASLRLQCLLTLVREFPESPATRTALLAAREDGSDEVRLQAGISLGREGRDTLLELASRRAANDSCAARAVAALGEHLSTERAQEILAQALKSRRTATAVACLECLGRAGGEAVVGTLAKALATARFDHTLGVAAAKALGATGAPTAEPPLVAGLAQDRAEVRVAAAQALGRVGGVHAVPALHEATERHTSDGELERAVRQATAEIQARLAEAAGAAPGQLSLSGGETGQVSLVEEDTAGRLTLAEPTKVARTNASVEGGPLARPELSGVEEAIVEEGPSASGPQARRSQTGE